MLLLTTFSTPKYLLEETENTPELSNVHLIHCVKLLSKHLEANFKHLVGMYLATDLFSLVFSSVNNHLFSHLFPTVVSCEFRYVGTTELKNIPYLVLGFPVRSTSVTKKSRCSD